MIDVTNLINKDVLTSLYMLIFCCSSTAAFHRTDVVSPSPTAFYTNRKRYPPQCINNSHLVFLSPVACVRHPVHLSLEPFSQP